MGREHYDRTRMSSERNITHDARFLTHHALRIKGFAKSETLAEMTALEHAEIERHLADLAAAEWAMFREARSLWQLTPTGKAEHPKVLAADVAAVDLGAMKPHYHEFLELNTAFKTLCGDWLVRHKEKCFAAAFDFREIEIGVSCFAGNLGARGKCSEEFGVEFFRSLACCFCSLRFCERLVFRDLLG